MSPDLVDAYSWEPSSADLEYMRARDAEYIEKEYGESWDDLRSIVSRLPS